MALPPRLVATTSVTFDASPDAIVAVVGAVGALTFACACMATQLDLEDGLAAVYMFIVLATAMGLFLPEDKPTRVRSVAIGIILVAGVSVAVFVGVLGCVLVGRVHWIEVFILIPPFVLATVLLRVACRQLKRRVTQLELKHYALDGHRQENTCPVCGFKDEPKIGHELWEPVYDVHRGTYLPGMLYSYVLQEYECGFASNGKCAAGPFESPRDLAEHMLNVHWDDGFHCPGCLRSLGRVRCGGGGGWGS